MTDRPPLPLSPHVPALHQPGARTNLPLPLTSFVGRTSDLADVERLLFTTRLLTLTGPGGVGKTRLAIEVGTHLLPRFADGIWMVDLAPYQKHGDVPYAVASALEVRQEGNYSMLSTLVHALQERQILLLLDNCEHLIPGCAEVTLTLLRSCPNFRVLATSRESLGLGGELIWRVRSLSFPPDPSNQHARPADESEQAGEYEAVQLFLERAQAVRPGFELTPDTTAAVEQICRRLDGIPLAIELATARLQVLAVEQLAAYLENRFWWLTSGNQLALPRQQTLRATLEWSYSLLTRQERLLFQRLSVFAGWGTLEAIEEICSDQDEAGQLPAATALDALSQLVNKSLVMMEEREHRASYRLLETVRQYGREKLEKAGESARIERRHFDYYLQFIQKARPEDGQQVLWLHHIEQVYENLRAAFAWALNRELWEPAMLLAARLWPFWDISGRAAEGCAWLKDALQHTPQVGQSMACGQALLACGGLAMQLSDYTLAQSCLAESLAIFRAHNDARWLALALSSFGKYLLDIRDFARGRVFLEESLTICEQTGDHACLALTLARLGWVAFADGKYQQAREQFVSSLALSRTLGDAFNAATTLNYLGELSRFEGDFEQAEPFYQEAWQIYLELGHAPRAAMALSNLAEVARARGDLMRAMALATEAMLTYLRRHGSKEHIYSDLITFGSIAQEMGEPQLTARLYGAAETLRETYGVSLNLTDQAQYNRDLAALRQKLDAVTFNEVWQAGRALSLNQAIALIEAFQHSHQTIPETRPPVPSPSLPPASPKYPHDLTPRELEVLRLLAEGLTNKQIAERLVISPKTVDRHAESILSKLGVHSRTAAARLAIEQKLLEL